MASSLGHFIAARDEQLMTAYNEAVCVFAGQMLKRWQLVALASLEAKLEPLFVLDDFLESARGDGGHAVDARAGFVALQDQIGAWTGTAVPCRKAAVKTVFDALVKARWFARAAVVGSALNVGVGVVCDLLGETGDPISATAVVQGLCEVTHKQRSVVWRQFAEDLAQEWSTKCANDPALNSPTSMSGLGVLPQDDTASTHSNSNGACVVT